MLNAIKASDHVAFLGRNGSGKTTAARLMLRAVRQFTALDPKHTFSMAGVPTVETYSRWKARQIVRPPFQHEDWEKILWQCWARKNVVCYIDELTLINEQYGTTLSPMLGRMLRTGRERKVTAWWASQRPKDIPSATFTETNHFFIFQLTWDDDRKKVVSFTNSKLKETLENLTGHQFVYYNVLANVWFRGEFNPKRALAYERAQKA